jgi:putative ABC transport system permease protein
VKLPFALTLAWREGRSSVRRMGVYMSAITLGVAALVAINSLRAGVAEGVDDEARALLGADIRISSGRAFPDSVQSFLDSLSNAGMPVSRVTSTVTVSIASAGAPRLIQLRAITGGYPYYGRTESLAAGSWEALQEGRVAVVEAGVLAAFGIALGDTLRIGQSWFRVIGTSNPPPEFGFRSAIGPRVFIAGRWLEETGVVRFGSLIRHEAYLQIPRSTDAAAFVRSNSAFLRAAGVRLDTAEDQAKDLAQAVDFLGRFLGLVGLMALLLGGLGVGSAIHVFVAEKRPTIAVLRCLGATQRTAFVAYLTQAAILGLGGAFAGVILGIAAQAVLPNLLSDVMPVRPGFAVRWREVLAGLATGTWVSVVFALLPLLAVRDVPPLRALRFDVEGPVRRVDAARLLAQATIVGTITLLALQQAPSRRAGFASAAAVALVLLVLRVAAALLMRATRRWFPRHARFEVRQGVAGLFRPHNQTAAVTVAIGFGVFLLASLWVVQRNLLGWLALDGAAQKPNLVAFDIQSDQRADAEAILAAHGVSAPNFVPIVTARITKINDTPARELLETRARGIEPWTLRREYRNTYRAQLTDAEELVAGEWWESARQPSQLPRISMEMGLATDLGVGLGDRITWDVQGVPIETRISNLRRVDWARFDTNFFVVFEPGVLDSAPQSFVTLAHVREMTARAAAQRELVLRHPNVTTIDLAAVQATLERIVARVAFAIRIMALVTLAAGAIVLFGAISAARFQRVRESVLLRTLGATRSQIRRILLTEYIALGSLGGVVGTVLGALSGWALVTRLFHLPFRLPVITLILAWFGVALFAALLGIANSRDALRSTPLAALREAD